MGVLAIIPARGGSKGILRKNVLPVAGKPMLAWAIEAAGAAREVERVVVSTDDEEIADVAHRYGAEVIRRAAEISGDHATSEAALLHVLDHLNQNEGYQPELTVFLQCTSPLTLPEDIDGTIEALQNEDADTAVAVTPFHYFLWREDEKQGAVGINHDKRVRKLRQQREPEYVETGAVYVMRTASFREVRHRFFGKTSLYVMPPERRLEIDEPADLTVAEVRLKERQRQERLNALPKRIGGMVMDFDGVLTDNRVLVSDEGREAVWCHRGDGMGLERLRKRGLPMLVLSKEQNPVVEKRCEKLCIECRHGIDEKLPVLRDWMQRQGLEAESVVYVGNDVNDVACLQAVGCGVAVADAHPEAERVARLTLETRGGHGAVRELCDLIERRLAGSCSDENEH